MGNHQIETYAVGDIFADFARNFRDPATDYADCKPTEKYDHEKFLAGKATQGLFEDILYNGVQTPIWVAVLTADQIADIRARTGQTFKVRVIRGHKRFQTVLNINAAFPGRIESLQCDAYHGLTDVEEWTLLADHGGTKRETPLSEIGEYRAVVNLFAAGFSQDKIAQLFGQKRGWSMRRVWIHQMGIDTPIETHYLLKFDPRTAAEKPAFYSFPLSDVDKLHKAYNADVEDKRSPMDDDSAFRKLWDLYAETGRQPKEEKALTRKAMDERGSFIKGRPALEELLKFASGRSGNAKNAAAMYDRLSEKAEKAESVMSELETVKAELETVKADRDNVKAELGTVRAELDSVKAELDSARKATQPAGKNRPK